ncbi:hypothetical protein Q6A49_16680 [Pseudomonas sp. 22-AL-CL-001]|nr:hypothetical protein [Pseudomonas sp. 22-AL-CL-001]MDO7912173.1 hypothetical protein [Pseudomonas sp. 22-AL-CL-001]
MVSFFSSGAGDYLALGEGAWAGVFFMWFHEEPDTPTRNEDVWGVMDAWMSIFLEDSEMNALSRQ